MDNLLCLKIITCFFISPLTSKQPLAQLNCKCILKSSSFTIAWNLLTSYQIAFSDSCRMMGKSWVVDSQRFYVQCLNKLFCMQDKHNSVFTYLYYLVSQATMKLYT